MLVEFDANFTAWAWCLCFSLIEINRGLEIPDVDGFFEFDILILVLRRGTVILEIEPIVAFGVLEEQRFVIPSWLRIEVEVDVLIPSNSDFYWAGCCGRGTHSEVSGDVASDPVCQTNIASDSNHFWLLTFWVDLTFGSRRLEIFGSHTCGFEDGCEVACEAMKRGPLAL